MRTLRAASAFALLSLSTAADTNLDAAGKCSASKVNPVGGGTAAPLTPANGAAAPAFTCGGLTAISPMPVADCKNFAECQTNCCVKNSDATGKCETSKVNPAGGTSSPLSVAAGAQAPRFGCVTAGLTDLAAAAWATAKTNACKDFTNCKADCCAQTASNTCSSTTVTATGGTQASGHYVCPDGYNDNTVIRATSLCSTAAQCNSMCCIRPTTCALYTCRLPYVAKPNKQTIAGTPNNRNCCQSQACAAIQCPAGQVKRPNSGAIAGVGSQAACCTAPSCAAFTCPVGRVKSAAASVFVGIANDANCCTNQAASPCATYQCTRPYESLVFNHLTKVLGNGVAASDAECCMGHCYLFQCPGGYVKKPNSATLTIGATETPTTKCCNTLTGNGPCVSFVCPLHQRKKATLPTTGAASASACCESSGFSCVGHTCSAGWRLKPNYGTITLTAAATDATCCNQENTCSQYVCQSTAQRTLVKKNDLTTLAKVLSTANGCTGTTQCTDNDNLCCQEDKCLAYQCPAPMVKKHYVAGNALPTTASNAACCENPTCQTFACIAPYVRRANAATIQGGTADQATCCHKPTCETYSCVAPLIKAPGYTTISAAVLDDSVCCVNGNTVGDVTTDLANPVPAGESYLPVASVSSFQVGREIVIDKNTAVEETNVILSVGVRRLSSGRALAINSLHLKTPLKYKHGRGASIVQVTAGVSTTPGPTLTPTLTPIPGTAKKLPWWRRIFSWKYAAGHRYHGKKEHMSSLLSLGGGIITGMAVLLAVQGIRRIVTRRSSRDVEMDMESTQEALE